VTDVLDGRRLVSQAFCSALPVAYGGPRPSAWEPLARLVLEGAYEATLLAAVEQANGGGSDIALLTRVGGGAFGNDDVWIDDAIVRIAELRAGTRKAVEICPEAPPQHKLLRERSARHQCG
jgi:hypothetical protein